MLNISQNHAFYISVRCTLCVIFRFFYKYFGALHLNLLNLRSSTYSHRVAKSVRLDEVKYLQKRSMI